MYIHELSNFKFDSTRPTASLEFQRIAARLGTYVENLKLWLDGYYYLNDPKIAKKYRESLLAKVEALLPGFDLEDRNFGFKLVDAFLNPNPKMEVRVCHLLFRAI